MLDERHPSHSILAVADFTLLHRYCAREGQPDTAIYWWFHLEGICDSGTNESWPPVTSVLGSVWTVSEMLPVRCFHCPSIGEQHGSKTGNELSERRFNLVWCRWWLLPGCREWYLWATSTKHYVRDEHAIVAQTWVNCVVYVCKDLQLCRERWGFF